MRWPRMVLRPGATRGRGVSDRFQRSRIPALPTVLFADASEDYRSMARDALLEGRNVTDMRTVGDGNALLAYLQRAGATEGAVTPVPSLIVDRRGPPGHAARQGGRRGAQDRRAHQAHPGRRPRRRRRPGARSPRWYDAGANTYIVKPVTFLALVRLMKVFTAYWLETAELPPGRRPRPAPWPPRSPTRCASSPSPPTTRTTRRSARCSSSAQIDHVTTRGRGARRVAATHAYDVILVDREIAPPGIDGLDAGQRARRRRPRR